jgi:hypothetical protein
MAYDKTQVHAVADGVVALVYALKDGIDVTDVGAATGLLTSFMSAADEAKDTDAFLMHLGSRILDVVGDQRVDTEAPGE